MEMEVKEREPAPACEPTDAPTINDLPNEILVMIFRRVSFTDWMQATLVCHRWHDIIFSFFEISFALDDFLLNGFRTTRNYKHFRIRSLTNLEKKLGESLEHCIEAVVGEAWSLDLETDKLSSVTCTTILRKFSSIRQLYLTFMQCEVSDGEELQMVPLPNLQKLIIESSMFDDMPRFDIVQLALGLKRILVQNTELRHLHISCKMSPAIMDLLEVCAHRLFLLVLTCDTILVEKFCLLNFAALKVLLLEVEEGSEPAEDIIQAVYSISSLEELTIENPSKEYSLLLDGVWRLNRLKKFRAIVHRHTVRNPKILKAIPLVSYLAVPMEDCNCIRHLQAIFCNIKTIEVVSSFIDLLPMLVSAWPALECLWIPFNDKTQEKLNTLRKLSKLRKLELSAMSTHHDLSCLGTVLTIPSLRELRIGGRWTGAVPGINRSCRVFVNNEIIVR